MKLLSLIAMGLACAMAGRYIAYRLSRRVRILEKISLMFGIAENEIKFLNRPTSELIELLEKKDELAELDFLSKSISYINEGDNNPDRRNFDYQFHIPLLKQNYKNSDSR